MLRFGLLLTVSKASAFEGLNHENILAGRGIGQRPERKFLLEKGARPINTRGKHRPNGRKTRLVLPAGRMKTAEETGQFTPKNRCKLTPRLRCIIWLQSGAKEYVLIGCAIAGHWRGGLESAARSTRHKGRG